MLAATVEVPHNPLPMETDKQNGTAPDPAAAPLPPTPVSWRCAIAAGVLGLASLAYLFQPSIGPRGQAMLGVFCFIGLVAVFSSNLRAVNWRTIGCGIVLQMVLAICVNRVEPVRQAFEFVVGGVRQFLKFTDKGSEFVFGGLADPAAMEKVFPGKGFALAFAALPTIIFVASFFTVLYYLGVLQLVVRFMARIMVYLLQTSGAETLAVTANIFMGQTEAPLIIKPYVAGMTRSELLTMMVGGMAHISGGLMAVYIGLGADPVAILTTSVMAAPCSLYLSKLFMPEIEEPQTRGEIKTDVEQPYVNVIDAAASGATDGMRLAINVAAMLIAFLAFIALFDALLHAIHPDLSLSWLFSWVFGPAAFLMGVEPADVPVVADLLGTKLAVNEFVAYVNFKKYCDAGELSGPSRILVTYALTGFANFGSIAIQLGGIGGLAPTRRHDLARLGLRALFVGFLVTLVNAAMAGALIPRGPSP